jgi:hypothetical protein
MWRPIETAPAQGQYLLYGRHKGSGARQQVIGERQLGDPRWIEPATIHYLDAWEFTHWRPMRCPPTEEAASLPGLSREATNQSHQPGSA